MSFAARASLAIAGLALAASPAQAMSVAEFLQKAEALKAKGLLAMGSRDAKLLGAEMRMIGAAYRADLDAAKKSGRAPHSCPPPKGKAKLDARQMIAELRAMPAARQRATSAKAAFYAMMKTRFPCR